MGSGIAAPWRRSIGRLGIQFREGEVRPAIVLFLMFFLLITFQYTTKSVRQSTFINSLGAEKLPWVYLFVAVSSYPFLRIYSRFADRMHRHSLIAATCALTAVSMTLFWWLYQYSWPWVAFVFYVWISITTVMMVSQFWSFSNHLFDARQAKRLFAFVGAGGLLGGVAGGQVAKLATNLVGTRNALVVAAGVLFIVVGLIWLTQRMHSVGDERTAGASGLARLDQAKGGFELLRQSKHLQGIASIMVLTVVVAQIVDLQFSWAVQESTTSLDQRTAFFGNFYSVMGIVAFLFQLVFTARIHRTLGVGAAMRILPVMMAIGTFALIGAAGSFPEMLLAAAVVLKVGENGVRYSLDQATRELLFLPIPSRARLKAKAFIDVFVQRAAKGLAALLLLPVTFELLTPPQAGWISLALIVLWIGATIVMRRQYVESFRAGLKRKAVADDQVDLSDATTLALVMQSLGSVEPRQVLHALRLLQKQGRERLVPPLLLYHDNAGVRRATLRILADADRRDALPLVERALSDPDAGVRVDAVATLARLQRRDVSALMEPYLDAGDPGLVAAAVVSLSNCDAEVLRARALDSLRQLMLMEDPEARAEAAKALGYLQDPSSTSALIELLRDDDPEVVRHAVDAVRRRVLRQGPEPVLAPSLISLLDNRRLKHEARRALVAFGEPVIPALSHFMNSSDERPWVRRALPRTIALINGPAAVRALARSLDTSDRFLLRKVIESLDEIVAASGDARPHGREIADAVSAESQKYFRALAALQALGAVEKARSMGPLLSWDSEEYQPTLLEKLLAERMADCIRNVFGLLALLHDRVQILDAHRSIISGNAALHMNAIEFLDNVLNGPEKRAIMAAIDEQSVDERVQRARKLFGFAVLNRLDVLAELIDQCDGNDGEASAWGAAALYEVYSSRTARLYPNVARIRNAVGADQLVRETAEWVSRRIDGAAGIQNRGKVTGA
jgi:AAA family ATP:ADP antiporter